MEGRVEPRDPLRGQRAPERSQGGSGERRCDRHRTGTEARPPPRPDGREDCTRAGDRARSCVGKGNDRTLIWFDVIRRYLVYRGYDVSYVMNYTDVDDKIIERAKLERLSTDAISAKYSAAFEQDMRSLGARSPDIIGRATDHIEDMVKAVEGLVEKGAAYAVDGDVFFAVDRFDGYGKLSGRSLDDMRAGERIEPHPDKRHPLDFAQAEALKAGAASAREWLHAGMMRDKEAEKMSKSIGDGAIAHDVLERYAP